MQNWQDNKTDVRLDYPMVQRRLTRWGLLNHLTLARHTRISAHAAQLYVQAIIGKVPVRIKRVSRSWAYPHNDSITLACAADRTVKLSSVLHECAHVLDYRKGRKLGHSSHGEPFCKTYARLLREVIGDVNLDR